jgi:hypothetical protein
MYIIIEKTEWKPFLMNFFENNEKQSTKFLRITLAKMKELGYCNKDNQIILNGTFTLEGFWNNFQCHFKHKFLDFLFKKIEEAF